VQLIAPKEVSSPAGSGENRVPDAENEGAPPPKEADDGKCPPGIAIVTLKVKTPTCRDCGQPSPFLDDDGRCPECNGSGFKCPSCGSSQFSIESASRHIACGGCGSAWAARNPVSIVDKHFVKAGTLMKVPRPVPPPTEDRSDGAVPLGDGSRLRDILQAQGDGSRLRDIRLRNILQIPAACPKCGTRLIDADRLKQIDSAIIDSVNRDAKANGDGRFVQLPIHVKAWLLTALIYFIASIFVFGAILFGVFEPPF
jgi:hypothetical protein